MTAIPTSRDVVAFLNERFAARGLPYRLEHIAVLPYMNPLWMANWDAPQLAEDALHEQDIIEERRCVEARSAVSSGLRRVLKRGRLTSGTEYVPTNAMRPA